MAPGLFLGWRIDSGFRYRYVTKVLDYQEYRTRGASCVFDVPEPELYIPDGDAYFPVGYSKHQALVRGDDLDDIKLPEIASKEIPFPLEGGLASPSTPGPKTRSVYITLDRIIKFKETPGCKGCTNKTRYHTPECRARFQKLVDEEKELDEKSKSKSVADEPPKEDPIPLEDAPAEDPPPGEGIFEEIDGEPEIAVRYSVSGAATVPKTSPSYVDLSKDSLPVFGMLAVPACPIVNQPSSINNRRQRRAMKKSQKPSAKSIPFEFACSLSPQLDMTSEQCGVNHVRLYNEFVRTDDDNQCSQLDYHIKEVDPNIVSLQRFATVSPGQYVRYPLGPKPAQGP